MKRSFAELEEHFERSANHDLHSGADSQTGAKHKSKATDKDTTARHVSKDEDGRKSSNKETKSEKSKVKHQREVLKDANGNDLKRPLTAYMLFNNFRRPVLQKDHPDFSLTDLSKLIGQEWKNLNEDQRKVSISAIL